ncbi:uncharacterized protein EKO05_0001553 [Ascochyta rabiei]|uniref:uncharacterized protein n=1 Tax=Didymella rabiei TaxID=5454 RepID=UPI0018FF7EC4|nr:uncharacterized protein EKO05_0001553 [Ascochyta rabiei]UPX10920.1 hypothetical protein EKO05_0001553 [Ascochyta rabiei]
MSSVPPFLWESESLQNDVFIRPPRRPDRVTMKDTHAYASFGDNGTTVSVNGYGNIMQITRFLNFGASGFLCVDSQYATPFYVQSRMEDILESCTNPQRGLRLDIVDWTTFQPVPSVGFMYDRWPRYIFNNKEQNQDSADPAPKFATKPVQVDSPTKTTPEMAHGTSEVETVKTLDAGPAFPLSIQYFCSEGSVVQTYLLNLGEGGVPRDKVQWGSISLKPDICFRGLNFVNDNSEYGTDFTDLDSLRITDDRCKLLVIGTVPEDLTEIRDAAQSAENKQQKSSVAVLIVSPFIGGIAAEIDDGYCITLKDNKDDARLELTIVYTVKIFEQGNIDVLKELQISANAEPHNPALAAMKDVFSTASSFQKIYFAPSPRSDFVFRRNLEHILSVCSIPIPLDSDADITLPVDFKGPAIAITCGDIAGHCVASRASLSAFQFLCSALTYLDPNSSSSERIRSRNRRVHLDSGKDFSTEGDAETLTENDFDQIPETEVEQRNPETRYVPELFRRVRRVLKGHISWICQKTDSWEDGAFAPHYWATGKKIQNLDYLSSSSLVDTPLQLIKVLHSLSEPWMFSSEASIWIEEKLRSKVHFWVEGLHNSNQRGTYAFPRGNEESNIPSQDTKFSLLDHVMISMAFRCIEELHRRVTEPNIGPIWTDEPRCYYTYREVRRKTLKRFTTEDPTSKQKVLATSRWSGDTRFLLHSKDTFLFSAANMQFFDDPKTGTRSSEQRTKPETADAWRFADKRWAKLLDAQAYQDEFELLEWSKPLWYTIIYVLGCKGRRVGNYSSEALIREANSTLLDSSWYNGLSAGTLGYRRMPACYDSELDRDNHWHAAFETPNIMWSCGTASNTTTIRLETGKASLPTSSGANALSFRDNSRIAQKVPKYVPFLNLSPPKDQLDRNVLSDDWLQSPPAILSFETKANGSHRDVAVDLDDEKTEDGQMKLILNMVQGWKDDNAKRSKAEGRAKRIIGMFSSRKKPGWNGIVVDVPKYSLGSELSDWQPNARMRLRKDRSVWESKKRIIWLSHRNRAEAQQVYKCCSDVEGDNVISFYERHLDSERFFLDSATAALNEWETELHLSYYSVSPSKEGSLYHLKGHGYLALTAVSFRFSGDFSDRFWTCLLLEHHPGQRGRKTLGTHLLPVPECGIRGDLDLLKAHRGCGVAERREQREEDRPTKPWQQRRILELLIYSKILEGIRKNTIDILDAVKALALQSKETPSEHEKSSEDNEFEGAIEEAKQLQRLGDKEEYTSIARQWRRYIQILDVLEESLIKNIEKMEEWQRREQDRQDQQPRWTERDKRNHFTTILRLKIFTERQTREIKRLRDKVHSFQESLPGQLESIREDINFRGSQSINLFTYVTVVFLPLGFATGVLSMNGLPDHSTSMNLVFTALAALALTLVMLLNAEFVKGMAAPVAEVYRSFVYSMCSLLGLRQLWQIVKYAVFHSVVKPSIAHRAQYRRRQKEKQVAPATPSQPQHNSLENGPLGPGQLLPRKLGDRQLNKEQQPATTGSRSHNPSTEVPSNAEQHDNRGNFPKTLPNIFKDTENFSFREAVENEEEKQEKGLPKGNDRRNTNQHGAVPQVPNHVGIRIPGERRDLDVEKGLGHAAEP